MKHGMTSSEANGHAGINSQSAKRLAGVERGTPYDEDPFVETGETTRAEGSKEYILPKIPADSVHVRKDVRVDLS